MMKKTTVASSKILKSPKDKSNVSFCNPVIFSDSGTHASRDLGHHPRVLKRDGPGYEWFTAHSNISVNRQWKSASKGYCQI